MGCPWRGVSHRAIRISHMRPTDLLPTQKSGLHDHKLPKTSLWVGLKNKTRFYSLHKGHIGKIWSQAIFLQLVLGPQFFFVKGALFWGKGDPPVLEEPARHFPHQGRGFVTPPVCPTSPTIHSSYGEASGGQLTNCLHQMKSRDITNVFNFLVIILNFFVSST